MGTMLLKEQEIYPSKEVLKIIQYKKGTK